MFLLYASIIARVYAQHKKNLTLILFNIHLYIDNKEKTLENKEKPKRLILDIPEEFHAEIKSRAALRGQTIRAWILQAIMQQIRNEQKYE